MMPSPRHTRQVHFLLGLVLDDAWPGFGVATPLCAGGEAVVI